MLITKTSKQVSHSNAYSDTRFPFTEVEFPLMTFVELFPSLQVIKSTFENSKMFILFAEWEQMSSLEAYMISIPSCSTIVLLKSCLRSLCIRWYYF